MHGLERWRVIGAEVLAQVASHPLRSGLAALATAIAVATVALVLTGIAGVARYAREEGQRPSEVTASSWRASCPAA